MIYEDKFGNFLGEEEINSMEPSRIINLGIHMFDMDEIMEALRG